MGNDEGTGEEVRSAGANSSKQIIWRGTFFWHFFIPTFLSSPKKLSIIPSTEVEIERAHFWV